MEDFFDSSDDEEVDMSLTSGSRYATYKRTGITWCHGLASTAYMYYLQRKQIYASLMAHYSCM